MKKVLLVAAITFGLTAAAGSAQVPVFLVSLTGAPQTQDPQKAATSQTAILHGHVVDARTGEALAKVSRVRTLSHEKPGYYFHPAVLDACFQVGATALFTAAEPAL